MSLSREEILEEMGIKPLWRLRGNEVAPAAVPEVAEAPQLAAPASEAPVVASAPASVVAAAPAKPTSGALSSWEELTAQIHACQACELCQHRQQAVPGVGDQQADWLFIGEGPGAEEDAKGEPFVGQAGKLLDAMLAAIDLKRGDDVYIANAVKCRPPGNRTPDASEMAACRPFLERQIALIQPRIIVLLGKAAVHSVMAEDKALAALRGRPHQYQGIPVVVTYHPAYLLRNLPDKAKAWEDLLLARRLMREMAPR